MLPRSHPPNPSGFVLLHTLFVLLACATIVGGLSAVARSSARTTATELEILRLDAAAEAGVHRALFRLLQQGTAAPENFNIDGHSVRVAVQPTDALPNLLTLDRPARQRLMAQVFGEAGVSMMNAVSTSMRPNSYAALAATTGVGQTRMMRLVPHITLHSEGYAGTSQPSAIGRVWRIQSQAKRGDHASRILLVEARLTGQGAHPLWVYEWLWRHDTPPDR